MIDRKTLPRTHQPGSGGQSLLPLQRERIDADVPAVSLNNHQVFFTLLGPCIWYQKHNTKAHLTTYQLAATRWNRNWVMITFEVALEGLNKPLTFPISHHSVHVLISFLKLKSTPLQIHLLNVLAYCVAEASGPFLTGSIFTLLFKCQNNLSSL